jgi:hypothetical protein
MKNLTWIPELRKPLTTAEKKSFPRIKLSPFIALFLLALMVTGFYSCEENMWLKSEKKLRGQVEGSWNRLYPGAGVQVYETWTFKDGVVSIVITEKEHNTTDEGYADFNKTDVDTISVDYGNFSIDTKIDNAYLKLSNLEKNVVESAKQGLNAKWTIVDISGTILYIAAENGSAIIQREFEKK